MFYTIDRTRAQELGLNVQSIANNINVSLSSSEQTSPNFWTDPRNGIPYYMAVQTPEYRLHNKNDLDNTPIASTTSGNAQIPDLLGNVASSGQIASMNEAFHQLTIGLPFAAVTARDGDSIGGDHLRQEWPECRRVR